MANHVAFAFVQAGFRSRSLAMYTVGKVVKDASKLGNWMEVALQVVVGIILVGRGRWAAAYISPPGGARIATDGWLVGKVACILTVITCPPLHLEPDYA